MRKTLLVVVAGLAAGFVQGADETNTWKSDKEKISYSLGYQTWNGWKRSEVDADMDSIIRGMKDAQGGTGLLTDQEISEVLNKFRQELMAKQREKQRLLAEKNKKEGEEFLAANKTKPGVITLTNGLQYKVLAEGSGDSPKPTDTVTVNYKGTLIDGTEFDSSAKTGKPATFRVNGVIHGWTEALTRMKPGAKWQLFIPSEMAYGPRGKQPAIGPNAALIFEVELISIQPPPPPPSAANPPPASPTAPLTSDIIKVPSLQEMQKGAKIETIKPDDLQKMQQPKQ